MLIVVKGSRGSGRTYTACTAMKCYKKYLVWDANRQYPQCDPYKSQKDMDVYSGTSAEVFSVMARSSRLPVILDDFADIAYVSIGNCPDNYSNTYFSDNDHYLEDNIESFEQSMIKIFNDCIERKQEVIVVLPNDDDSFPYPNLANYLSDKLTVNTDVIFLQRQAAAPLPGMPRIPRITSSKQKISKNLEF